MRARIEAIGRRCQHERSSCTARLSEGPVAYRISAWLLAAASLFATTTHGAEIPALQQQVESTPKPIGSGYCATQRTGAWLAEGGVVVEIQKPKGGCKFETLELLVDGRRLPLAAVDKTFYRGESW